MTSRSSSASGLRASSQPRGGTLTRRVSALSNAEEGVDHERTTADHAIHEEIAEIKRYEDFTTIDWVQDAAREQLRRKARRQEKQGFFERGRGPTWRRKLYDAYDAGQAWIVVSLVGIAIGLNAAFLNIITEWLSDIKLGYCTTAFYLNEQFCCWGAENGCKEWRRWSTFWPVNYLLYIVFSTAFAFIAGRLVKSFAPYAAGSGISEIKCIVAGFVMKGFLGFKTLAIKSITLPLAIASGLSVGKEGPSVHYAVCTGNVVSRMFNKYKRNASKTREILTASAAAGVGVAFGSPIGGVLFSLEAMNPFRTGQLVMFQVKYDRDWHFFEVIFYIILGVFGGLYGAFVIKWNLRVQAFRKKYLAQYPILEATTLALVTAIICYPNMFLRIDMTESMEILFRECEGAHDYDEICDGIMHITVSVVVIMFELTGALTYILPTMIVVGVTKAVTTSAQMTIDMSRFVDPTPLAVHPRLPLETVMELFKKMGPRVILVEYRGRLTGLITVKDCLKYQFKVEAQENPRDESAMEERGERLWTVIRGVAEFIGVKIGLGKGKDHSERERAGQEDREDQGLELQDR
ncbi:putative chloride channel protein [Diplodia seriata]|uniref:Chloride channel protein n=1 Tax=Diplodia seriata TaxID=420778 RepID=A0A0G2EJM7_9PEZI|nr:putative chloride channel protein [Diplodia seriata]